MKPKISIIVAVAENGVIGRNEAQPSRSAGIASGDARPEATAGKAGLLWHIPEDMRHFKELTTGHAVIMGRKTYETIGKPLPNRMNIVITRDPNYKAEGTIVVHSLMEALEKATQPSPEASAGKDEVFIMGGGEIYKQAIGLADKLYLTLVHKNFEGDVYFPDYAEFKKEISRQEGESASGLKFTWLELERE